MRALAYSSILIFLHGAEGTGFLPAIPQIPPLQPVNERALQFPQVIGYHGETVDPAALAFLQVEGFHVETPDPNALSNLQVEGFQVQFSGAIDPYFTHRLSGD